MNNGPLKNGNIVRIVLKYLLILALAKIVLCTPPSKELKVDWNKVKVVSQITPTLQVVVNPPLERGSSIHDRAFSELSQLGADFVRYVPWLPYPKLGVAELEPPSNGKTFWDFSLIDPMTEDFINATRGHPVILNFSTIPAWMWETPKPVPYPSDPSEVTWDYTQGTKLRDRSGKELGDYYARLVSWYVNGGFTDEYGKRHESGHHYKIDYWEVLNEVDFEHKMTPELYTFCYDTIAAAIKRVAPSMKFIALALAIPGDNPQMFEYFLDPKRHRPGVPIDMISYHFYASPASDESPEVQQFTFFDQADGFIATVRYIEEIRKRLAPNVGTDVDEIGSIAANDNEKESAERTAQRLPNSYWNLSGATYAYVFGNLAELGITIAGESQLVGYPTQFPSVTMLNWKTGAPNARFRVLQLLKSNFGRGDKIVDTDSNSPFVYALGFIGRTGQHKLLLVNKRDRDIQLTLPAPAKSIRFVDETTKEGPPATQQVNGTVVNLHAYEVGVVTLQ
jgi:hypothetical protein